LIQLTREPIDEQALLAAVSDPTCGAVMSFSGTVRNHHLSRRVNKLAYEAYIPMAMGELERVVEAVKRKWPEIRGVQIIHRFGEMQVGESSIFLTVAAPHRAEAFEALRHLIDRIKRDVPIWKKEFYEDGASDWLHPEEGCCAHHLHLDGKAAKS